MALPTPAPTACPRMEPFVFIIPVRNAEPYIARCLERVLGQRAAGWGAVVVDDASSDGTWKVIEGLVGDDPRFTTVRQASRKGSLFNIDAAVTRYCAEPSTLVAIVDGDDWLAHDRVIERVRAFPGFDVLWSTHETWPKRQRGISDYLPPTANVREYPWVTSHLRVFRKVLFDRIDKLDFLDAGGRHFTTAGDMALMMPLLELAGPARRRFLDEVLYVYNRETALNDDKVSRAAQADAEASIRARRPYECFFPARPDDAPRHGLTGWRIAPHGPARLDDVDDSVALLAFDTRDPGPGACAEASRTLQVEAGQRLRVTLEIRDSYPDDRFPNRIEQQVRIDGRVVWRHDIGEGSEVAWNPVEVLFDATSGSAEVDVRLVAIGQPEPGWRWGDVSRTAIRGFKAEVVGETNERGQSLHVAVSGSGSRDQKSPASRAEPFVFVIPVFNAESYIGRCLASVQAQRGLWGAIVIDDCSTDSTWSVVEGATASDPRFTLKRNARRRSPLRNVDDAITSICANPASVIAVLDGDDWLIGSDIVETFLALHASNDVVWSNSLVYPSGELGWSNYLPMSANVRRYPWVTSHLRTFKKRLFDCIDKQDFLDADGQYYTVAGDVAFMLPLLELAGPGRRAFLDEVCCMYNRENPLNEDKQLGNRQLEVAQRVRARPPYAPLSSLSGDDALGRDATPWEPFGNVPVEFHTNGPEFVFIGPAETDPAAGSYAGVRRVLAVEQGRAYVLKVSIRDSYSDGRFGGRFEQQVYVDEELVWRHDLSGGPFAGWNTVAVRHIATGPSLSVRVQLTAVGAIEPGWNWGELGRTLVRGFDCTPVAHASNV